MGLARFKENRDCVYQPRDVCVALNARRTYSGRQGDILGGYKHVVVLSLLNAFLAISPNVFLGIFLSLFDSFLRYLFRYLFERLFDPVRNVLVPRTLAVLPREHDVRLGNSSI